MSNEKEKIARLKLMVFV